MFGNSPAVTSDQTAISPRLTCRNDAFYKPFAAEAESTFAAVDALRLRHAGPLIVDAGCGTGVSTTVLANRFTEALIIGVDRSAHRLARQGLGKQTVACDGNAVWLCMDLVDFWRLASQAGWHCERHYLLYPNPWPKHKHVKKRWHAHPVFNSILALGGLLEVRSNWRVYIDEFAHCVAQRGDTPVIDIIEGEQAASPFEAKYAASEHKLFRLRVPLTRDLYATVGRQAG